MDNPVKFSMRSRSPQIDWIKANEEARKLLSELNGGDFITFCHVDHEGTSSFFDYEDTDLTFTHSFGARLQ